MSIALIAFLAIVSETPAKRRLAEGFRLYYSLFDSSHVRRLVATSLFARLAIGIFAIPLFLVVVQATNSYAAAGTSLAVFSIGTGITAPIRGRLVDRYGNQRALPPLVLISAGSFIAIPIMAQAGSTWILIALSGLAGAAIPPLVACMRIEWQHLLGVSHPRLVQAYSFESAAQTALYVVGALIAGIGIATVGAKLTLIATSIILLVGGLLFAQTASTTTQTTQPNSRSSIRLPAVRTIVFATILADTALGIIEVTTIAFAKQHGSAGASGLLIALFATGAVLGAVMYGARVRSSSSATHLIVIWIIGALTLVPVTLAGSIPALCVLIFIAGLPVAAGFTVAALALDAFSGGAANTESFTWLSTANSIGLAIGAALAGKLIQQDSTTAAFTAASLAVGLAALFIATQRRTLLRAATSVTIEERPQESSP